MSTSKSAIGPSRGFHPDTEMNFFGWLIFLPLLLLLLPVIPLVVLYWLLSKAVGSA
ncbi:MAG: hypothetical protein ABEI96_05100 [Haloarculaceae archaeon]